MADGAGTQRCHLARLRAGWGSASPEGCREAGAALQRYRRAAGEARGLFTPFQRSDQQQGPAAPR